MKSARIEASWLKEVLKAKGAITHSDRGRGKAQNQYLTQLHNQ